MVQRWGLQLTGAVTMSLAWTSEGDFNETADYG